MPCPNSWNHQRWKTQILSNSKVPSSLKVSTTRPVMAFSWALHVWGFHPFLRKATKMVCKNSMLRQVSFRRRVMANFPLASLEVSQNHTFFHRSKIDRSPQGRLDPMANFRRTPLANKEAIHILDITHAVFYIFKIISICCEYIQYIAHASQYHCLDGTHELDHVHIQIHTSIWYIYI